MKSTFLKLNNGDVEVFYSTSPEQKGDYESPPFPEEHEIKAVNFCDIDIMPLLSDEQVNELQEQLI